jgi:hypothetical protein
MNPGDDFRPSNETSPQPILKTRIGTFIFPSPLADVWDPPVRTVFLLPLISLPLPGNGKRHRNYSALLPRELNAIKTSPIKPRALLSYFPFPPLQTVPPGCQNGSPESAAPATVNRRFRRGNTTPTRPSGLILFL